MTIPSHSHLFEQADRLAASPGTGAPRQVDLRRAISAAYYGLFHFVLRSAADQFVGSGQRNAPLYALVYRSVEHRTLRDLCNEALRSKVSARYAVYVPKGGFDADIQAFSRATIGLQNKRHTADYDPQARFVALDARLVIGEARGATAQFDRAGQEHRRVFLTMLVCPPR